ncbi:hypothetical protein MPSEU_001066200 [Mayamaea pseudoterrestris]|nr:hypothetical protein MPSEU_001066200 [Mayamaea pseudoterrestris]
MVKAKILKQLRKTIDKADKVKNLLECAGDKCLQPFTVQVDDGGVSTMMEGQIDNDDMTKRQIKLIIETVSSPHQLCNNLLEQALLLFETNMGDMYRNSSWGLDMVAKRAELGHRKARYLIVRRQPQDSITNDLVAFAHFRFELDDEERPDCVVLYVYEVQIASAFRKQGLGKKLMGYLEQIGRANTMEKIMLTVFKQNAIAMDFYKLALGYVVDCDSPKHKDYEILSKSL